VDDYGAIRRAKRDGKSIRQIAREFHLSRNTVRKVLKQAEPTPTTRQRGAPKLGPFQGIIDQILHDDHTAPLKQRHTAAQLFRRLRDEHGYGGGYAQVQRYLHKHHRQSNETFIPLGQGLLQTS
jgi:transposase